MNWLIVALAFIAPFLSVHASSISAKDYVSASPRPLDVKVFLSSTQVTAPISAKLGGKITLKLANGDLAELEFPENSLPYDLKITLREITSIKNNSLGTIEDQRAVQILPEGTLLYEPAVLTIKLKNTLDQKKTVAFTSTDQGKNVSIALAKTSPNEIKFALQHFSNYGYLVSPTIDEIIGNSIPTITETRLENWLSWQISNAKKTGTDPTPVILEKFREAFDTVVKPSITEAHSCTERQMAFQHYIGWARGLQMIGINPDSFNDSNFSTTIVSQYVGMADECFEPFVKMCYDDHLPFEAIGGVALIDRTAQLLGTAEEADSGLFSQFVSKCSQFRFFLESEFWAGNSRDEGNGLTAKSDFNFTLVPGVYEPIEGEINVVDSNVAIPDFICERNVFQTLPGKIILSGRALTDSPRDPQTYAVIAGGFNPQSAINYSCRDKFNSGFKFDFPVGSPMMSTYFGGLWAAGHGPTGTGELSLETGFYRMPKWEIRDDHRWLAKNYSQTIQGAISETSEIVIYHEPTLPRPKAPNTQSVPKVPRRLPLRPL